MTRAPGKPYASPNALRTATWSISSPSRSANDSLPGEQAVALAKAFLDPVLGGRTDGWWQPERRAEEP